MTTAHDLVVQFLREAICVRPECPACAEHRRIRDDLVARRLIVIENKEHPP